MKTYSFTRLMMSLAAMLTASTIHANCSFWIDNFFIADSNLNTEIVVPINATFDNHVSTWELQISYPEGLNPIGITQGDDMNFTYIDSRGQERPYTAQLRNNDDFTHIVGSTFGSLGGYFYDDEGEEMYDYYGCLKWESGAYNDLIYLTLEATDSFRGGYIYISSQATCGYDTRFDTSHFTDAQYVDAFAADLDQDGAITIADASMLIENWLNNDLGYSYGGDINQDGIVDIQDFEQLMDYLLFAYWYDGYEVYYNYSSTFVDANPNNNPINEPTGFSFQIATFELNDSDLGQNITIPVGAHFENYISSWDIQFDFPEGLTPISVTKGQDLTMTYYNEDGDQESHEANFSYNNEFTHFIGFSNFRMGYPDSEGDENEPYGTVKWAAGDYPELFFITCHVSDYFAGGQIEIHANASCGYDTRNELQHFEPTTINYNGGYYYPGDCNMDGEVTVADITCFINYLLNPYSEYNHIGFGDVTLDGIMDIADVDAITDYLLYGCWFAGYVLSQNESLAEITLHVTQHGDINGDGHITISDLSGLIDILLEGNEEYLEYADVNNDGAITISDVSALIDILLNMQ